MLAIGLFLREERGRAAITSVVIATGLMTAHQAENHGGGTLSPPTCPFLLTLCHTEHFSAFAHLSLRLPPPVCPNFRLSPFSQEGEVSSKSFLPSPLSPEGFCGDRTSKGAILPWMLSSCVGICWAELVHGQFQPCLPFLETMTKSACCLFVSTRQGGQLCGDFCAAVTRGYS